jgi:hypothetical protein
MTCLQAAQLYPGDENVRTALQDASKMLAEAPGMHVPFNTVCFSFLSVLHKGYLFHAVFPKVGCFVCSSLARFTSKRTCMHDLQYARASAFSAYMAASECWLLGFGTAIRNTY